MKKKHRLSPTRPQELVVKCTCHHMSNQNQVVTISTLQYLALLVQRRKNEDTIVVRAVLPVGHTLKDSLQENLVFDQVAPK